MQNEERTTGEWVIIDIHLFHVTICVYKNSQMQEDSKKKSGKTFSQGKIKSRIT